jgi:DNA-binding PucR family transcriptional regulator
LQRLYLDPLAYEKDGGAALRQTLRAYFMAGRHVSSTAAALGVSRQTVAVRLRTIEDRIGRSLDACASEIDTALRMQELSHLSLSATDSALG